jgi:hypothetical protein
LTLIKALNLIFSQKSNVMTVYKILKAILLGLTLLAVAAPAAQAQMSKKQA